MDLTNGLTSGTSGSSTEVPVDSSIWVGITWCNGIDWLENRFADKELENPLSVSQPLSVSLSLQERSITYRAALSICYHQDKRSNCSVLLSLNLNHCVHFWAACFNKGINILEQVQTGVMMVQYCTRLLRDTISVLRDSLDTQPKITHSCWTCFEPRVELDDHQRSCQL